MEVHSASPRVVIVEDEGLIAEDLKGQLEKDGYAVACIADTGEQALQAVAETAPDLVMMDIRLKGEMDGIAAADLVHQRFHIPVVYLTAYEDPVTVERVGRSQAVAYLKKPIVSSSLHCTLALALSQHREEESLRQQRDWFQSSFAAISDAVVITDEFGRLSYLNAQAEELTGWESDAALGKPWKDCVPFFYHVPGWAPEDLQPVEDMVSVALLDGGTLPLPHEICLAGREHLFPVEGTISARWFEGRLAGTAIQFRDVSLQRLAERLGRQDHKQEALGRMAGALAGRLNLELGIAADESAAILQSLPAHGPLRERVETLEMATLDAYAVVGNLQQFARKQGVRLQPVRINELVSSLRPSWQRTISNLSVLLGAVPAPAEADPYQLTRALLILLKHAQGARRPGAGMVVETSRQELAGMGPWARIRIAYASYSEGADLLERAFEPTLTPENDLALCYALIHEMGGFLSTGLEQNMTVAWEVYLKQGTECAGDSLDPAAPTILLVEPNPRVGLLLQHHFDEQGLRVVCAANCRDALAAAQLHEGTIALIIANVPASDPARQLLADFPTVLPVHWVPGYRDSSGQVLTKGQLLALTRSTLAAIPEAEQPLLARVAEDGGG